MSDAEDETAPATTENEEGALLLLSDSEAQALAQDAAEEPVAEGEESQDAPPAIIEPSYHNFGTIPFPEMRLAIKEMLVIVGPSVFLHELFFDGFIPVGLLAKESEQHFFELQR